MMSLAGHLVRINYGVPGHVMKIFHRLYRDDNVRSEDLSKVLLRYEITGEDVPADLKEKFGAGGKKEEGKGKSVREEIKSEL